MFSRRGSTAVWRPVIVWTAVTVAAAVAITSTPGAWSAVTPRGTTGDVDDMLVAVCASGLAAALGWLWVVTTATVVGLLAGREASEGGATRRLVLVACGAAVLAGTAAPSLAAGGGDGPELLVGLALPERAVAPAVHRDRRATTAPSSSEVGSGAEVYVVRPGDSLWSIARSHPLDTTTLDHRWRSIWAANRNEVGDDPDLIIPGQALRLPTIRTTGEPNSDGDRS